jgi:UDP-N-acetyl-D-glucosamine dehydrogenase
MTEEHEILLTKIETRLARVAVIGLGYVGLPLAVAFAKSGFRTFGIDVDDRRVAELNAGRSYISDVPQNDLAEVVAAGKLKAMSDFGVLGDCDAVSICVPTPLSKTHDPDLSYVISAVDEVARHVHSGMLIVLESTTYPGTTEEIIIPKVAGNGYQVGRDVFVAFSPERTDPGRKDFTLKSTPKIVGGATAACLEAATALYSHVTGRIVPVSSVAAAEMAKLLENTFRAVNIALANEVLLMCDRLGLNAWEVIEAAATKPYGFMKFTPGPGVGGHCIPLDPQYLSWKLRTLDYRARFVHLADEINRSMPSYWVDKVVGVLTAAKKEANGSRVLILGVTYKPNIDDLRESPALDIIKRLGRLGIQVSFHDPFVTSLKTAGLDIPFVEPTDEALRKSDCVMIVTDHAAYDWERVRNSARVIVDCRNALNVRKEKAE